MLRRTLKALDPDGFHDVAYVEWGDPRLRSAVVCVHGLTRNGRDFDALASALAAEGRRVVCPDIVGRGKSGRLRNPAHYGYPQYCADMAALLARLDVDHVDWVGTSMGGLIGMLLASRPGCPIRRLVMNDVGPFLPKAALARITAYVGLDPSFPDAEAAEQAFRHTYAGFGDLTDAQWRHLVEHGTTRQPDGSLRFAYDPAIALAFTGGPLGDVDLWPVWDRVSCPTLILRGANSDLLSAETAAEMTRRGPKTRIDEIPNCGHAPALMDEGQIGAVRAFLLGRGGAHHSQDRNL